MPISLREAQCAFSADCQEVRSHFGGATYCLLIEGIKAIKKAALVQRIAGEIPDEVIAAAELELLDIGRSQQGGCIQAKQVHHEISVAERALDIQPY